MRKPGPSKKRPADANYLENDDRSLKKEKTPPTTPDKRNSREEMVRDFFSSVESETMLSVAGMSAPVTPERGGINGASSVSGNSYLRDFLTSSYAEKQDIINAWHILTSAPTDVFAVIKKLDNLFAASYDIFNAIDYKKNYKQKTISPDIISLFGIWKKIKLTHKLAENSTSNTNSDFAYQISSLINAPLLGVSGVYCYIFSRGDLANHSAFTPHSAAALVYEKKYNINFGGKDHSGKIEQTLNSIQSVILLLQNLEVVFNDLLSNINDEEKEELNSRHKNFDAEFINIIKILKEYCQLQASILRNALDYDPDNSSAFTHDFSEILDTYECSDGIRQLHATEIKLETPVKATPITASMNASSVSSRYSSSSCVPPQEWTPVRSVFFSGLKISGGHSPAASSSSASAYSRQLFGAGTTGNEENEEDELKESSKGKKMKLSSSSI